MGRPRRKTQAIRFQVTTSRDNFQRLNATAIKLAKATDRLVTASAMAGRGMPAMLAALESCADCRAGTCDGTPHVRRGDKLATVDAAHEPAKADASSRHEVTEPKNEPFTLRPVVPVSSRRARKAVPVTDESPAYRRVVAAYFEHFERVRGTKPHFDARTGKTVRGLLEKYDVESLLRMLAAAFADPWWAPKLTITEFARDPDRWAGERREQPAKASTGQGGEKVNW